MKSRKAVITILGIAGKKDEKAKYSYNGESREYHNVFDLILKNYSCDIVPIFTPEAKEHNQNLLNLSDEIFENGYEINSTDFDEIFAIFDAIICDYDEIVVDVSHGFRHLSILMIVDLIIQNFADTNKIKEILFTKELERNKSYEIIDLKYYLDISNLAFIISAFDDNFTVASHIKVSRNSKFDATNLIKAMQNFSDNLLGLNIGNLLDSKSALLAELEHAKNIVAIKNQVRILISNINKMTDFDGKKYYQTYAKLAQIMYEKNYLFQSVALLFESMRMYVKSYLKNNQNTKNIIIKMQDKVSRLNQKPPYKNYSYDMYDLLMKLRYIEISEIDNFDENFAKLAKTAKRFDLSSDELKTIIKSYPRFYDFQYYSKKQKKMKKGNLYDRVDAFRNDLAHVRTKTNYLNIKNQVADFLSKYNKIIMEHKV